MRKKKKKKKKVLHFRHQIMRKLCALDERVHEEDENNKDDGLML